MKSKPGKDRVQVITMGCSKNLVDSENIITQLRANDVEAEHESEEKANVIIVNTCGFIESAKQESIDTILEYAEAKNRKEIDRLIVTGCLSHRYKDELAIEIPEVDAFFGTMELPSILAQFNADYRHELIGEKVHFTPPHYAYVKISEGCNRTCSFCAIPLMRGGHRSRPIDIITKEARHLAAQGVKEIILIAQELTYYGLDLYKQRRLPELLKELCRVDGIEWIRLHYAYPSKFPKEVFDVMAEEPKICNYLDIPLQHAADDILKAMRRQITRTETQDLIAHARKVVPNIAIRTTMLVGFPGEKEKHIRELLDFVAAMQFDRLGVFEYSHEENTTAFEFQDDVPVEEKSARAQRVMSLQQEISLEKNQRKQNQVFKVLIDRKEQNYYYGRTEFDSPEVDNEVLIEADNQFARVGDFAQVLIDDVSAYDLYGSIIT